MAATLNLVAVAKELVALNLVSVDPVSPVGSLLEAGDQADQQTFEKIARVLLERSPPLWLKVAVSASGVSREYIPQADLDSLSWLGDVLDIVLVDVWLSLQKEADQAAKALGDAAELLVFAALKRQGGTVIHVSRVSDVFGYDIERHHEGRIERIEVKAASAKTADSFIISRNEFNKSQIFQAEWRLIQVVFTAGAVFGHEVGADEVVDLREISPRTLREICPQDSSSFIWRESAQIRPDAMHWTPCEMKLDPAVKAALRKAA